MPYYKFQKNDLFNNVVKTHPTSEFSIYDGKVFYNNTPQLSGAFTASIPCVPPGNISLYELNVDRNKDDHRFLPLTDENQDAFIDDGGAWDIAPGFGTKSLIFPFITASSDNLKLKHITDKEYNEHYSTGDMMTGSYPLSASIKRNYYTDQHSTVIEFYETDQAGEAPYQVIAPERPVLTSTDDAVDIDGKQIFTSGAPSSKYTPRPRIMALRNTLDYYKPLSNHFAYSSSEEGWRKDLQEMNLISIPSIYYGQSIKKGSVDLKFFVRGKLVGRVQDLKKNGELLDVTMIPFSHKSIQFDGYVAKMLSSAVEWKDFVETIGISMPSPDSMIVDTKHTASPTFHDLTKLTISMWIHRLGNSHGKLQMLMQLCQKHAFGLDESGQPFFWQGKLGAGLYGATPVGRWTATSAIQNGQWYHVAVSYDGTATGNNPVIYVNGTVQSLDEDVTPTATINTDLAGHTSIGNALNYRRGFEGFIDEVSMWSTNLSAAEVSEIYNDGNTRNLGNHSKYSNLLSWWRMGEEMSGEPLDLNSTGGKFPSPSSVSQKTSNDYLIPDEKGSNTGYMKGFSDLTKHVSDVGLVPMQQVFPNFKYANTGITEVAAPTSLTGAYAKVEPYDLVAGVVLYNEGFILLTGSWDLDTNTQSDYLDDGTSKTPRWTYFGSRLTSGSGDAQSDRSHDLSMETKDNLNPSNSLDDAFFHISLSGTNYVPTKTMLVHAPKGRFNHSNNMTYIEYGSSLYDSTGSLGYFEGSKIPIKNIVSSSHPNHSASFEKHTYISKIGIYDENRNLIGISKLATPVRKREIDNLTFKLKLDI